MQVLIMLVLFLQIQSNERKHVTIKHKKNQIIEYISLYPNCSICKVVQTFIMV